MALTREYILDKFSKPMTIGICGVATAGKDTFFTVLKEYLNERADLTVKRFALADKLKDEINPYLMSQFGISAWTTNPEEKKLIRPSLVSHGFVRRQLTKGKYWTAQIEKPLTEAMAAGIIPVVTDIRYAEFDDDEVYWITKFGGKLAYITRYYEIGVEGRQCFVDGFQPAHKEKVFVQPPNEDERRNDPKLRAAASTIIEWDTFKNPSVENLAPYIEQFITAL